jgi:hypothetical protein
LIFRWNYFITLPYKSFAAFGGPKDAYFNRWAAKVFMVEPSRRFKPDACQKCGLVTRDVKQAEIGGKWYYACSECRGFPPQKEGKEGRRARLQRLYSKEMID